MLITITALVHITCLEAAEPVKEEAVEPVKEVTSAVLETDMGRIVITFYREDAPKTVENFTKLVNEGFYDGHTTLPPLKLAVSTLAGSAVTSTLATRTSPIFS